MSSSAIKVIPVDGNIDNQTDYDFSDLTDTEKFQYINSVCMIQLNLAAAMKNVDSLYYSARKLINIDRLHLKSELQGVLLGSQIVKIFAIFFF